MKSSLFVIASVLCVVFSGNKPLHAFTIESLDGEITPNEIKGFISSIHMKVDERNYGNAMATHKSGTEIAGICRMYEATRNIQILDIAIHFADVFVVCRNDQPKGQQLKQWTGKIEPVWPLRESGTDAGAETGAVAGHIGYVAYLILDSKEIWDNTIPDGDPNKLGATYKARALTYLSKIDECLNQYITKYCVDPVTYKIKNPSLDPATGSEMPWNVQMMFMAPHLYSAKCHDILGDNPNNLALCKAVVNKFATWFVASGKYYTTPDGHKVVEWYYMTPPAQNIENQGHAQHDMRGLLNAYESGYAHVTSDQMKIYADTAQFVINKGSTGAWGDNVRGTGPLRNSLKTDFIFLAKWNRPLYKLIAQAEIDANQINAGSEACLNTGTILLMKHWMHTHPSPNADK